MDIVHTLKNIRNIKIYAKNQDPALYLASKFEEFNFLELDKCSSDNCPIDLIDDNESFHKDDTLKHESISNEQKALNKKALKESRVTVVKGRGYENDDMSTSKVFGGIAHHNRFTLSHLVRFKSGVEAKKATYEDHSHLNSTS